MFFELYPNSKKASENFNSWKTLSPCWENLNLARFCTTLKKKKKDFCAENQREKSQRERLLELFFFIELKPILGFRVIPQYTYSLSGTKDFFFFWSNLISRASWMKNRRARGRLLQQWSSIWKQGLSASLYQQGLETLLALGALCRLQTLKLFILLLSLSVHSPACLTREAMLCDGALDFVSICFST